MNVSEINPDWLMYEIAKLNSRSFVNLSKSVIEEMLKQSEGRITRELASKNGEQDIKNLYGLSKEMALSVTRLAEKLNIQIQCNKMLYSKIESLEKQMSKLTTKERKALPKKDFALPKEKKYPMPDKSHAANAKARATQMEKKGKLSESAKEKIDAKANKVLKGKKK